MKCLKLLCDAIQRNTDWIIKCATISSFFIALISTLFYLNINVEDKINEKILSNEFIKRVTYELLPIVLFDHEGNVLFNRNADEYIYIDDISVVQDEKKHEKKIIIKTKLFLEYPPILYSLEASEYFFDGKRVNSNTFIYKRINIKKKRWGLDTPINGEDYIEEIKSNKYKLEIVR